MNKWIKLAIGIGIGVGSIVIFKKVTEKKYTDTKKTDKKEDKSIFKKIKKFVQEKILDKITDFVCAHPQLLSVLSATVTFIFPAIECALAVSQWRSQRRVEVKMNDLTRSLPRAYSAGWNDSGMDICDGLTGAASDNQVYNFFGPNGNTLKAFKVQEVTS